MEYFLHIVIMLDIYVMLVLSANMTIGMANLLTLCQAAFYGIGAYIGTFFLMQFNLPFVVIAAAVMLLTGAFSWLVSYASVRLKGDYFVIATMGFQMIVYTVLYNWIDVTRGPYGIPGIPGIKLLGLFELRGVYAYLVLSLVAAVLVALVLYVLMRSPFGRTLNAIRADETVVQSLGRDTAAFKSWVSSMPHTSAISTPPASPSTRASSSSVPSSSAASATSKAPSWEPSSWCCCPNCCASSACPTLWRPPCGRSSTASPSSSSCTSVPGASGAKRH